MSTPSAPAQDNHTTGPHSVDPFHNPSYPKRTHFAERTKLAETLNRVDERMGQAAKKLAVLARDPRLVDFSRLYHQMMGARDQIAECARRIPREAGELYHEDHERLDQAVQAFERVVRQFESKGA